MPPKKKPAAPRRMMVLAAVIRKNGRILIARRKCADRFGGQWEFPGGKLEPGETPQGCLERELMEEFGVTTGIGRFIASVRSDSPGFPIRLDAYGARHLAGEFKLHDHDEIRWARPSELEGYDLTAPDRRLLAWILKKKSERAR